MIRLVLADEHPIVVYGLRQLFTISGEFEVLACVTNGEDALQAVRELQPDILMLGLRLPGKSGLQVLGDMQREAWATKTVILTALNSDIVVEAISLGAAGVVLKDMAVELLVKCVRDVYAGGYWLGRGLAGRAVERLVNGAASTRRIAQVLTPRELEVATLVAEGLPSKVVASRLAINEGTAKLHLHNIYKKLKIPGRMALARFMQHNVA